MPDRRKPKPKYTLERDIPGAFEGETVTRRRFMVGAANGAGTVATAAIVLPALGFALAPVFKTTPDTWQAIGPPSDFTETDYVVKVITLVPGIGEAGKSIAYVRARNPQLDTEPEDKYNHWLALSSRCSTSFPFSAGSSPIQGSRRGDRRTDEEFSRPGLGAFGGWFRVG